MDCHIPQRANAPSVNVVFHNEGNFTTNDNEGSSLDWNVPLRTSDDLNSFDVKPRYTQQKKGFIIIFLCSVIAVTGILIFTLNGGSPRVRGSGFGDSITTSSDASSEQISTFSEDNSNVDEQANDETSIEDSVINSPINLVGHPSASPTMMATTAAPVAQSLPNVNGPWPECVGMLSDVCKTIVEQNTSSDPVSIYILSEDLFYTMDVIWDRVRIFVDEDMIVVSSPYRG